jgi:hypothetical protein
MVETCQKPQIHHTVPTSKTKSREKWSESNNLRKAYDSDWLLLPRVWYGTAVSMIMSHNLGLALRLGLGLGLRLGLGLGHLFFMASSLFASKIQMMILYQVALISMKKNLDQR